MITAALTDFSSAFNFLRLRTTFYAIIGLASMTTLWAEHEPTREFLLFENGELLKDSSTRLSSLFSRKAKLRDSIARLQTLIDQYPDSPLRSDAAYLNGDSHEILREYKTAVSFFLTVVEYDKDTDRDALFRAAEITDKKLKNQGKAFELYQRVVKGSPSAKEREKAQTRLAELKEAGFGDTKK